MTRVWLDGVLVPAEEAVVHVNDRGLTVGDGVFETLRTVPDPSAAGSWRPFAVRRHLHRLRTGLDRLGIDPGVDDDVLRAALDAAAHEIDGPARVRLTVTAGPGPMGSGRAPDARATVLAAAAPFVAWPPTGSCATVPYRRNEHGALVGVKATSYAENVVALAAARATGAAEALVLNTAGALCEGTSSNVFVVVDGETRTPPLTAGCLAGVTRALVCEIAGVVEADVSPADLAAADEVFLTSTTRDVQGQHRVDGRDLPAPGPVTARIAGAFADLVAGVVDP